MLLAGLIAWHGLNKRHSSVAQLVPDTSPTVLK